MENITGSQLESSLDSKRQKKVVIVTLLIVILVLGFLFAGLIQRKRSEHFINNLFEAHSISGLKNTHSCYKPGRKGFSGLDKTCFVSGYAVIDTDEHNVDNQEKIKDFYAELKESGWKKRHKSSITDNGELASANQLTIKEDGSIGFSNVRKGLHAGITCYVEDASYNATASKISFEVRCYYTAIFDL